MDMELTNGIHIKSRLIRKLKPTTGSLSLPSFRAEIEAGRVNLFRVAGNTV